jgi:hypothetical protein
LLVKCSFVELNMYCVSGFEYSVMAHSGINNHGESP